MRALIVALSSCLLFSVGVTGIAATNTVPAASIGSAAAGKQTTSATTTPSVATGNAVAPTPAAATKPSYETAIRNYQEQHFNAAFSEFQNYFKAGHDFAALDYNWGLAAYKVNQKGLAAGLWRRALFLNPDLSQASQALSLVLNELPQSWSENLSSWNELRTNILDKFTFNQIALLSWFLFCLSGLLFIRYISKRRKALRTEQPSPPYPTLTTILAALFIVTFALTAAKGVALNQIHATVIAPTSLRTGPSEQDNPIFDLLAGFDVSVKAVQNGWAQVALDSGQVGWIPVTSLFQHTGRRLLW